MSTASFEPTVAYFSMEIAVHPDVPTYAGGLGMLAGDTIKSAADLNVPLVAVTLLHRQGYFYQRLDSSGWQIEEPVRWAVEDFVTDTGVRTEVTVENRPVAIRAWQYDVRGEGGFTLPVYLLDADLPDNSEWDRRLTDHLYGGDESYRLCQEVILGIGGLRMLRALGYHTIDRFHMNEGHAALLTIELLREVRENQGHIDAKVRDFDAVRSHCVFTTHTPVPAGHDQFELSLVERILGSRAACGIVDALCHQGRLNMTYLALSLSRYVNGVAKRHGEVSRNLFAGYHIDSITNGVHASRWVTAEFSELFDRHIAGWRQDNYSLRYALSLSNDEVWNAHQRAKDRMIQFVNRETNAEMDNNVLTLGFARRATAYKRADLVFTDIDRLARLSRDTGGLQLVFSGKAHPQDETGKRIIQQIIQIGRSLPPTVRVAYLPNYDMELAQLLVVGVDLWLNTPEPPLEASGTSGMKAALNGVPSLSALDGWWIEGCIEGVTGWAIGDGGAAPGDVDRRTKDASSLYDLLEHVVIPMFYHDRQHFIDIMRHAIALNGSFFNTHRMIQQYVLKAYF